MAPKVLVHGPIETSPDTALLTTLIPSEAPKALQASERSAHFCAFGARSARVMDPLDALATPQMHWPPPHCLTSLVSHWEGRRIEPLVALARRCCVRCPLRFCENRGQLSCRPMPDNGKEAKCGKRRGCKRVPLTLLATPVYTATQNEFSDFRQTRFGK